jgi:hypothetical protein
MVKIAKIAIQIADVQAIIIARMEDVYFVVFCAEMEIALVLLVKLVKPVIQIVEFVLLIVQMEIAMKEKHVKAAHRTAECARVN